MTNANVLIVEDDLPTQRLTRAILERHSGRIWIEDGSAGHGTRVSFTVPVGDDEQALIETTQPNRLSAVSG